MKVLAVFALIFFAGLSTASPVFQEEEEISLADAMIELRQVLRLQSWIAAWGVRRMADRDVCEYSNRINEPGVFDAAAERIRHDPIYVRLSETMTENDIPWVDFTDNELLPALGYHTVVEECTTNEFEGVEGLRNQIRGYFDAELIFQTVERLQRLSPEFRRILGVINEERETLHELRCSTELLRVGAIKREVGIDFTFIFEQLSELFGWEEPMSCDDVTTPEATTVEE